MKKKTSRWGVLVPIVLGVAAALIVVLVSTFLACGASCGIISLVTVRNDVAAEPRR